MITDILSAALVPCMAIFSLILRRHLYKTSVDIDSTVFTENDFTIYVTGLPIYDARLNEDRFEDDKLNQ